MDIPTKAGVSDALASRIFLYGTAVALVFNEVFSPTPDPIPGTPPMRPRAD